MSRGVPVRILLTLISIGVGWLQAQVVTATQWVSTGRDQKELLRKINGRWWTQDNREVQPPKQTGMGFFWIVDSKPGVCEFYHHRPFDIRKAEWVHLWMKPDEAEAVLGPANRRFAMGGGRSGMYYWYAADGTALQLWFMEREELGQAKYLLPGGGEQPVASFERELGGESIFRLSARRAGKFAQEDQARRVEAVRSSMPSSGSGYRRAPRTTMGTVEIPRAAGSDRPAEKRIVSKEDLAAIQPGAGRDEVIGKLGEPSLKSAITGDDGVRETFTYHLEDGKPVAIKLVDGKVVRVQQ